MNKSQVVFFLKKLTSRELKRLEEMLHSPFFNKNERCIQLFEIIKEEILEKGRNLDKKDLFKTIFPHKKRFDTALSVLMSRLLALVQEVIVQEQMRLRPHSWNYLLLKGLSERGTASAMQKIGQNSLKKINSLKKMTREDYQNRYFITKLLYEAGVNIHRNKQQAPEAVAAALDSFYLSHRLPLAYEIKNVQQILAAKNDFLAEKVLVLSQSSSLENEYLVRLFQQSLLLVIEPEVLSHFEKLLVELELLAEFIPKEELHHLYIIGSNYCIQQILKGHREYYQKLFEIYQKMIEEKVLFVNKYISAVQIKNVVSLSCQLGKLDWAHDFVEEFSQYLNPKIRRLNYNYYRAIIYFYQKNYEKARELLVQTESMEVFFEIGRKFFLLKIYYELQEEIALAQLLDSFTAFIRNNKALSAPMKTSYLNFAKVLKSLDKVRWNFSPKKLKAVQAKLEAYGQVSDKKWLKEKVGTLEKNA